MHQIVSLTQSAGRRLASLVEGQGGGKVVRLSVKPSGCAGLKYDLSLSDAPGPHDERVEENGGVLYVDPLSVMFVAGTTVDWAEDRLERRFVFDNPNAAGSCGCGESFHAA